jgi:histidinol phosphatase-like enzyme
LIPTGRFLQNHYREAVSAVNSLQVELLVIKNQLGIEDGAFAQYIAEEKKYLQDLKKESPVTAEKAKYV